MTEETKELVLEELLYQGFTRDQGIQMVADWMIVQGILGQLGR
jgi:hypothetical protein